MGITLFSEFGGLLGPTQIDANWASMWRTPAALSISAGILTVTGWGCYRIDGASASNPLTQINGTVTGDEVRLFSTSAARLIVVTHGTLIRLANAQNWTMDSPNDNILLRNIGGGVLVDCGKQSVP